LFVQPVLLKLGILLRCKMFSDEVLLDFDLLAAQAVELSLIKVYVFSKKLRHAEYAALAALVRSTKSCE
jgi:hypothetical protein